MVNLYLMTFKHRLIFYSFLAFLLLLSCSENEKNTKNQTTDFSSDTIKKPETTSTNPYDVKSTFSKRIFKIDSLGWAYEILSSNKVLITQPHIPAINGVKGFQTEIDAQNVADLVIYKLENKIFPPSLSIKELDSLNIQY